MAKSEATGRTADAVTRRLRGFLVACVAIILLWSLAFMAVEGRTFLDAVYFTIVTVTTVGYGDVTAATGGGKVLAILLILSGAGAFGGLVASLSEVLLNRRERRMRVSKLNMVVGAFFSEVGTWLLTYLSDFDASLDRLRAELVVRGDWSAERFERAAAHIRGIDSRIAAGELDLALLRDRLTERRDFMLRLLENPTVLEHERFSDLLLAVFHLTEELASRKGLADLPPADLAHLGGDIHRVYGLLIGQWLDYMRYLKESYPYLFSLAMRTNPFDEAATPTVRA